MKRFLILLGILLNYSLTSSVNAESIYHIAEDEGGIYLQTDEDGSWYIDRSDIKLFKVGESGIYQIKQDQIGTYLKIDDRRKFYIDLEAYQNNENFVETFNEEQESQFRQNRTKVIIERNQVLVPVTIGYAEREIQIFLLLDTGASAVALHREIAEQLNMKYNREAEFRVVGGNSIRADVVKLGYIKAGPFKKDNIYAGIIDHKGPKEKFQGLLGMNFLRGLEYRIDFEKGVINWIE